MNFLCIYLFFISASHVSQYPSLNFLLYVPKASESPLYIRDQLDFRHNQTDNFLVPQWGGVTFYNVKNFNQDGDQRRLFIQMRSVMKVFVSQLQLLLGLPNPVSLVYTKVVIRKQGKKTIKQPSIIAFSFFCSKTIFVAILWVKCKIVDVWPGLPYITQYVCKVNC